MLCSYLLSASEASTQEHNHVLICNLNIRAVKVQFYACTNVACMTLTYVRADSQEVIHAQGARRLLLSHKPERLTSRICQG